MNSFSLTRFYNNPSHFNSNGLIHIVTAADFNQYLDPCMPECWIFYVNSGGAETELWIIDNIKVNILDIIYYVSHLGLFLVYIIHDK